MERPTYTLCITNDSHPENPRSWDNAATMWCAHRRYNLGDEQINTDDTISTIDHIMALPLYLYDHSGVMMRTTPFSCGWDSGQVGWITMSKTQILNAFGGKRITARKKQQALDLMRSEVAIYDAYLTGEVYEYVIKDADGEIVESCCGYFDRESAEADGAVALARWNKCGG